MVTLRFRLIEHQIDLALVLRQRWMNELYGTMIIMLAFSLAIVRSPS